MGASIRRNGARQGPRRAGAVPGPRDPLQPTGAGPSARRNEAGSTLARVGSQVSALQGGTVPLNTFKSNIQHDMQDILTRYGLCSIQIWLVFKTRVC